ncbi:hypothetical protein AB0O90_17080 [Microbacterium testaceum]|uniref:hypothetical protein n=1 Tax=Microbacterium testaceum TaxID=2033 RepID=UPI00343CA67D
MDVTTPGENTTNPAADAHLASEIVGAAALARFGIDDTRETRASLGIPQDS